MINIILIMAITLLSYIISHETRTMNISIRRKYFEFLLRVIMCNKEHIVAYHIIILSLYLLLPEDNISFFSIDSFGDSIDKTFLQMLARRYAPTLNVASKVSSVLLKRI